MKKDINQIILEKGLKKSYIAKKLGLRPETLSKKLSNPDTFNVRQADELIDLLNVPLKDMNFGSKNF